MKKIAPIKIKLQVGGTFYDMSEFTPEEVATVITHVNAVQAIMDKHNNAPPIAENDLED